MGLNDTLCAAVTPIVPVCVPELYEAEAGTTPASEYCSYNYFDSTTLCSEGKPRRIVRSYQLHYVLPIGADPEARKLSLLRALIRAGFTAPTMTDASDNDVQHWVFEFQGKDGISYGNV